MTSVTINGDPSTDTSFHQIFCIRLKPNAIAHNNVFFAFAQLPVPLVRFLFFPASLAHCRSAALHSLSLSITILFDLWFLSPSSHMSDVFIIYRFQNEPHNTCILHIFLNLFRSHVRKMVFSSLFMSKVNIISFGTCRIWEKFPCYFE